MQLSFWNGKSVFLTGHTGFKGSWLALWLERLGADVVGFSLPAPTDPSLFEGASVATGLRSIIGDIRDLDAVAAAVAETQPDIVIHMAAQSLVRHGYDQPIETFATNVLGTAHVLEAARRCDSVRALLSVTTDKCYENREWHWGYRENDRLGGKDPYSSSKAAAELVTAAYRQSFLASRPQPGGPVMTATARSGNVIGGGDWAADRLVPDLVRGILDDRPTLIRCPDATRPWQHVLEPLRGYLDLVERLWTTGEPFAAGWNFGPGEEDHRTVGWLADRVVELWGGGARWQLDSGHHPPEATFLKLDCSQARNLLGWRPALPLDRAVEWVVEWYQAGAAGRDERELTLSQIAAYEELACSP